MQQVDEAVPVLASMDKDVNFRKAVSSLKAVHPPRNIGNKMLPANLTKAKQEAPATQTVRALARSTVSAQLMICMPAYSNPGLCGIVTFAACHWPLVSAFLLGVLLSHLLDRSTGAERCGWGEV